MPCGIRMSPVMYVIFIYAIYMLFVFPITELICYLIRNYTDADAQRHHSIARGIYLFFLLTFIPLYFCTFYLSWRKNRAKPLFTPRWKTSDELDEDDFTCTICYDLIVEPHTLRCQHSFCKKCITQCLLLTRKCPSCQQWVYMCRPNSQMKSKLLKWIKKQGRQEEYAEVVQVKKTMKLPKVGMMAKFCGFFQPFFEVAAEPREIRLRPMRRALVEPVNRNEPTALAVDIIDEFEPAAVPVPVAIPLEILPAEDVPPSSEPVQCSTDN